MPGCSAKIRLARILQGLLQDLDNVSWGVTEQYENIFNFTLLLLFQF